MGSDVIRALRGAVEMCGFDLDEVMGRRTARRPYPDLRAVVWALYSSETGEKPQAVGRRFGWPRSTVKSAISKAADLRIYDRGFSDLYDAVHGYYMMYRNDKRGTEENDAPAAQGAVEGEA